MSESYAISEIYGDVVQGEGLHSGWPCSVLRFSRCNLWTTPNKPSPVCPFCDTPQLHSGRPMTLKEIVDELHKTRRSSYTGLIISGGEPLLQLDEDLLSQLSPLYDWIDIETNGTIPFRMTKPDNVFLSCSPKLAAIKLTTADWYKVLIPDKEDLLNVVSAFAATSRIYVQPVEVGGYDSAITKENIRKCVSLCAERGYRLSIQTHKVVGVR